MPKIKGGFAERLENYIEEFGDCLTRIGNSLYCKACHKEIKNPFKKSIVKQHMNTNSHLNAIQDFDQNEESIDENLLNDSFIDLNCNRSEALIRKYVREFSHVLTTFQNKLFCRACNKEIKNPFKKSIVKQHFATNYHMRAVENFSFDRQFNPEFSEQNRINESVVEANHCEQLSVNELKTENELITNDLDSQTSLISILESIKDKVKLIISQCICDYNRDVINDVKALTEEYDRRKAAFIYNRSSNNNKNSEKSKTQDNSIDRNRITTNKISGFEVVDVKSRSINNKNLKTNGKKIMMSSVKATKVGNKDKSKSKSKNELNEDEYLLTEELTSSGKNFLCPWPGCDRKFKIRSQLRPHLRTHTGEKKFKCDYPNCGRLFERRSTLDYHLEKHKCKTFKLEKNIACDWPECDKMFVYKFQMNYHKRVHHLKLIRFKCEWPECESGFVTRPQYDSHVSRCHVGQNFFKCEWPDCGKRFLSKYTKQNHYNKVHLKFGNFKCDYESCGQSFTGKEELESHTIEAHNGYKSHACDWPGCEFSTLYSKALKYHKMRHTGEKPFKCSWPQCVWSFRQSDHLKTHMLKHTGERPFSCDHPNCELRFQSKHTMKVHFDKTHKIDAKI